MRDEIDALCRNCGREPRDVTLIAISKTHPVDALLPAYQFGARHFGESRLQEAFKKIEATPPEIEWHLIGTLQKNKVRKAIGKFALIHSVENHMLAEKIAACSGDAEITTKVLLQVNCTGEPSKHGLSVEAWRKEIDKTLLLKNLSIEGLMTIAPFTHDEILLRKTFRTLRRFRDEINEYLPDNRRLKHLSMGMSNDYRIAIEEGATLLRIGSAIFGKRMHGSLKGINHG